MTVTEKKEETIENSNKNEKVDCEITSGMQHSDTQDKDKETSDLEVHIDCGERSQEISEVKDMGADYLIKLTTRQVCRMCFTVYNRKNHFKIMNEHKNIKAL